MEQQYIPNQVVVELKDWLTKMSPYKREYMVAAMKLAGDMDLSLASVPAPKPEKPVCRECGSDQVVADASAVWSDVEQCWQVHDTYDKGGWCEHCEGQDIRFDWIPVDDYEAPNA
jgi:hypothetical protein